MPFKLDSFNIALHRRNVILTRIPSHVSRKRKCRSKLLKLYQILRILIRTHTNEAQNMENTENEKRKADSKKRQKRSLAGGIERQGSSSSATPAIALYGQGKTRTMRTMPIPSECYHVPCTGTRFIYTGICYLSVFVEDTYYIGY